MAYTDKFGTFFGRLTENGDVAVFHDDGAVATRLDCSIYPTGSSVSARYEHPTGIVISAADAAKIGIDLD